MRPTNDKLNQEAKLKELGAKVCRKCGETLALSDFGKRKTSRDGLQANCKPCVNAQNKVYADREDYKQAKARAQRKRRARSPQQTARYNRTATAKKYGLTLEEYDHLMSQGCSVCDEPAQAMDHCHTTGRVRGPLCDRCNHMLGHAKDNPETLARAIFYLLGS